MSVIGLRSKKSASNDGWPNERFNPTCAAVRVWCIMSTAGTRGLTWALGCESQTIMGALKKATASVAGVFLLLVVVAMIIFRVRTISHVMTKRSPNRLHSATLTRTDSIDRNFWVAVDGQNVFSSEDFSPGAGDAREQIVWSSDGGSIVLLVAEQRLMGYSLSQKRKLTNSELFDIKFPSLEDLGFEGTVPSAAVTK